ncbi:MAG: polyprenol monophosphomannose synthase [Planctomycetota bacterium]
MKLFVVVPTFNEKDNVERLVTGLMALNPRPQVLYVDDSSPDGTADEVERWGKTFPEVRVLRRLGKGGRGSACMAGFQRCFEQGLADDDVVIEMDADMSHNPSQIPSFLSSIEAGADLVVGSRYLPGGRIENWPLARTVLSIWANRFAKVVLGMPLTDYTTGFRAYRGSTLRKLNFSQIHARGYIVLTEMAYQIHLAGGRLAEVPIVFVNRTRGESNLSLGEVVSAFTNVIRLRFDRFRHPS